MKIQKPSQALYRIWHWQGSRILSFIKIASLLVLMVFLMLDSTSMPAQAKTWTWEGSVDASSGASSYEITIPKNIDKSRAIVLRSHANTAAASSDDNYFSVKFKDGVNNVVEITRAIGTAVSQIVRVFVIESDAFDVYAGEYTIPSGTEIATTASLGRDFTDGKTFVSWSTYTADAVHLAARFVVKVDYNGGTNDDTVTFERLDAGSATTISYFVVEMVDDSTVQFGTADGGALEMMLGDSLSTPVDRSKSFMIFDYKGLDGGLDNMWRGSITSDLAVSFNKRSKGNIASIGYYVIELGTLGWAESGQGLLTDDNNTVLTDYSFTTANDFDENFRFGMTSMDSEGGQPTMDKYWTALRFTDKNTFVHTRGDNGQAAVVDYFCVRLEPLKVFSPNGGELWKCGEEQEISWYAPGRITNVNIYLSDDSGATWPITIVTGVANNLSGTTTYNWTPAASDGEIIGSLQQIMVVDQAYISGGGTAGDTDCKFSSDTSDADFEIIGKIEVTYPNGGETIAYGDAVNIAWNFYGPTGSPARTVAIKYDDNSGDGGYLGNIVTGENVDSSPYSLVWASTPLPLGNTIRVKVEQVGEETRVFDASNTNFTVSGDIVLNSPAGGETWKIGDSQDIVWTPKGAVFMTSGVDIKVSRNAGGTYNTIVNVPADNNYDTTYPGQCFYSWTVEAPGSNTNEALVRVASVDYPQAVDTSAGLTIQQTIAVDVPSGTGIIWRVGQTANTIDYTIQGTVNTLDIMYATAPSPTYPDDFKLITPPAGQSVSLGTGTGISTASYPASYGWASIPDDVSDTCTVRIQDHDSINIFDVSDNYFKIKGGMTVNQPVLDEVLHVGVEKTITCAVTGTVNGTADVLLSTNGGSSYDYDLGDINITGAGNYTFPWSPGSTHMAPNCLIKIVMQGDTDTQGVSNAFSVKGNIALTYPKAQTGVQVNIDDPLDKLYIKWTPEPVDLGGGGLVNIRYDLNSGNDSYPEGNVVISNLACNYKPNAVDIGYEWQVPDTTGMVTNKMRVKVYQVGEASNVYDTSDVDFSVLGTLTLTGDANGGATWELGTPNSITWTAKGDITPVNIYYTTTGAAPYNQTVITDLAAGSGNQTYIWDPADPSTVISGDYNANIKFRIEHAIDSALYYESDNVLTIKKKIILDPMPAPILYVDNPDDANDELSNNVTWTTYGALSQQVKLAYDINGGTGPYIDIATVTDAGGYFWAIPNAIGNNVTFKVMSNNFSSDVYDASEVFEIKGKIAISHPDATDRGASAWKVNAAALPSSHNIQWRNCGDLGGVSGVNIYFSTNGGTDYVLVASETGGNGLQTYNWEIPATWDTRSTIDTDNRIKITDADDETNVYKESDYFDVIGQIQLLEPDASGDDIFFIGGTAIPVEWNYAGQLGNIDIYFSSDRGVTWEGTPRATIDVATAQPYDLAVPNVTTTEGKIKVEQNSNTSVASETPDPGFAVKGDVTITNQPTGTKRVGDDLTITWSLTGSIANVAIDYDKNSGNDNYPESVVSSTPAAAGSYTWSIPTDDSAVSENVRIRIRDSLDATVQDTSTVDFQIKPIIEVAAPVGGEEWVVGSLQTISWTPTGFAAGEQIQIEYSEDGGSTWPGTGDFVINSGIAAAALNYGWSIPVTVNLSSQCVIRVSRVGDSATSDDSNWFTLKGALNISAPDGGVNLSINSDVAITWTRTGNVGDVALYYATNIAQDNWAQCLDSGGTPLEVASSALTATWRIPDAPSATVVVKLVPTTVGDPTDENISDADNAIIGSIAVVHPMNAEEMIVGTPYTIEYSKFGAITNFKIEYHDGTQWNPIVASTTDFPNYTWVSVDDNIGSTIMVKVSDASNGDVYGESTADNIIKGSIDLTDPDGAETLVVGTPFNITWTKTGTIGNIKIEYSEDNFSADTRTISASYPSDSSPFPWSPAIDDITNADNVTVRVTSLGGIPVTDISTNPFKIVGAISNVQPSGSTIVWRRAETKNVTWNQAGNITNVDIKYKTAAADSYNKTLVLNDSGHADGANTKTITVPDENSEDCWIQVSDTANSDVKNESAAAFSIRPTITVSSPAGGADLEVGIGKSYTVDWSLNGSSQVTTVNVVYSTNGAGGPFDNVIQNGVDATLGTIPWATVSDTVSNNCYVQVVDTGNANVYGLSGNGITPFNIQGTITLQAPNGNEDWAVGSIDKNITWTKTGTIGNVNIYVDYGSGYEVTPLATIDSEVTTLYNWNPIPDEISNSCKIKVEDADNANVFDESDAVFHIIGGFSFNAPDGSPLTSGDPFTIDWTPTGSGVNNVKIEFYDGSSWSEIVALANNSGTYGWTVPSNTSSTQCKIRITASNPVQPATETESAAFWVHGAIDITDPVITDEWVVGTTEDITFDITGDISNVNIQYSKDGFSTYETVVSGLIVIAGSNTHQWAIPTNLDILTPDQAQIRVIDAAYATVYDDSASFALKGAITVLTPSADNIALIYGGLPYNITWSVTGLVQDVRIYYSTNGGITYPNEITTPVGVAATPSSYSWDIPDVIAPGKDLMIKIVDVDNTQTFDVSDNTFEIVGQLTLDAPVGGEKWTIASSRDIQWTPTGTFTNVEIEASIDDFSTTISSVTVAAGVHNVQQTYSWTVPDAMSSNAKIRISDPDHRPDLVNDTSSAFIILGGLELTSPESAQIWYVGQTDKVIAWNATGTVPNVRIEYKTSAAGAYTAIVANDPGHSSPGANTYTWSAGVADENSETCYIRVSDVANYDDVFSVSDGTFSIRPQITVSTPASGDDIEVGVGQPYSVDWSLNGSLQITNVDIAYSTNGSSGPFSNTIANNFDATLGTAPWSTVNDTISNNVVVRVIDTGNANVYGLSNTFNIVGSIAVTSPNANEDWAVGAIDKNITWTKTGTIGNVKLYADYGSGYEVTPLATIDSEISTLYNWNPIPDEVSNTCKIKITDADNEAVVFGESGVFHIIGGFSFNAPDGSPLTSEDAYTIDWTPTGSGVNNVKIDFYDGTSWSEVAALAANSGQYSWTVPSTTASTQCKVRLTASSPVQPATEVESGNFWIHGAIDVTAPVTNDEWSVGTTEDIVFDIRGAIDFVNILYSKDGGVDNYTALTIATSAAVVDGVNTYQWSIPTDQDILSAAGAKIKVVDAAFATVFDVSDDFMLKGALSLLTPTADNIALVYGSPTPYEITWSATGPVQNVNLYYSVNDGVTYPNLINTSGVVPAIDASFNWDIPDEITVGKQLKVKVVDADNSDCFDVSGYSFEIIGQLQLTAPVGGEKWKVADIEAITWTPTGTFNNVRVEASLDDFSTHLLDTTQSAAAGSYNWTIPSDLSNTVKVRISDPDHRPDLVNDTSADFYIQCNIEVTAPESGQVWYKGDISRQITWDASGILTNVIIEYKTSVGGAYQTIVADDSGHSSGSNSYTWTAGVADENSETCYVRVSDVNNYNDVYSVSDSTFSIRPDITISSPTSADDIEVGAGKSYTVDWSLNGSTKVTNVNVQYSTNGVAGPFDNDISLGVDATLGTVSWSTVLDTITNTAVIRVTDVDNANVYGESDTFDIIGSITVTAPAAGADWPVDSSQNITWTKTGTIGNVNIYADYNGDGTYDELLSTEDSETTTLFNWSPVPDQVTNLCKIKIADADNEALVFDESEVFSIAAEFGITRPVDLMEWIVDDQENINWSRKGSAVTLVKLEYTPDNGSNWYEITSTAPNSGVYAWDVPDAISTSCKVRISDPNNADANALSGGFFIIKGSITVTDPNAGTESLDVGTPYPIKWTMHGAISTVDIYYSANNGGDWSKINGAAVNASIGQTTGWSWGVPDGTTLTTQGLIRVVDTIDATVVDESDNIFEVKGSLSLSTPSAADISMEVADTYVITWTNFGVAGSMQIHYSTNGGIAGGGAYPDPANLITTVLVADGSANWSVPDDIGSNLRIRIRSVDNYNVWDESANAFTIRGKVNLDYPVGNEILYVTDPLTIRWTPEGTYSQVKLEYSTNGFADELETTQIAVVSAGTSGVQETYAWNVPDAIGGQIKVRASDNNNSVVESVCANPFTIKGKIQLQVPNGGEEWVVGSTNNIVWQRTGSIANVKLEYSTDAGNAWTVIENSVDASVAYPWTVPADIVISNQVVVRVSDALDGTVSDVSDANNTVKGTLQLTAPNGPEAWEVGTSQNITWDVTGLIGNVELHYSTDGGSNWTGSIGTAASSAGSRSWTIPDSPGSQVKVRVRDIDDTSVVDVSDANFKIVGSISVISPNGTEQWKVGETNKQITWTMNGNIANVKIEYSINGGASYDYLIVQTTAAGGLSYYWPLVADTVTTQARVRVSDAAESTVYDESDADFKIQAVFDITAPDGGEVWVVGAPEDITWDTPEGTVSNVKLEYSIDGGVSYLPADVIIASTSNSGTYGWTVPDKIGSLLKVKVSDVNDTEAFSESFANFKIKGALDLTDPNSGETLTVGGSLPITWTVNGSITEVTLEYFIEGVGYTTIDTGITASDETYTWTPIPDDISEQVKVRIKDSSDPIAVTDESANYCYIRGTLTLQSPNGTEEWEVASGQTINWTRNGSIDDVNISYSLNSGSTYPNSIFAGWTDATPPYEYNWSVPDDISQLVRVRIADANNDVYVYDTSDADFTIKGKLEITYPNGGEILYVGDPLNVAWNLTGSIALVKLELSADSGSTWSDIIASTGAGDPVAGTGSYAWSVPDNIGDQLQVRITDNANSTVTDVSNGDFTIKGKIALSYPNGGETLIVDDVENITWIPTGTITNVKIDYSTDGGSSWNEVIAATPGMAGSYAWSVPNAIGSLVKVRIADASDSSVSDESIANFTISGSIIVTSPNGGELWGVGTTQNITWDKTGTMGNLTIQYATDGGTNYTNIITNANAEAGSYAWGIPDNLSKTAKVRIVNNDDNNVNDASDTNFKIVGIISVTSPNAGTEKWEVGTQKNITWTKVGNITDTLRLEYSTNNGASYTTITSTAPAGALSSTWDIPEAAALTTQALIRISEASDSDVFDVSDNAFMLMAKFEITAPDGGEVWVVGSSETIDWITTGSATNVRLDYSIDGGATYDQPITASTPNNDTLPWTVPDTISSQVKIKISDYNNSDAYDESDANFKVRGDITVTSPTNGTEAWIKGQAYDITWAIVGSISLVNIEYSTDSGTTYNPPIANDVDADNAGIWLGSYNWTIPDTLSKTCVVKITDASDASVFDISDADFKIRGDLTLMTPNGTEEWEVDSVQSITWSMEGSIPNVKLELSTNNGASYLYTIINSYAAVTGSYPWQVEDRISSLAMIRISVDDDPTVYDVSDAAFKIKGVLELTAPVGGEEWLVLEHENITWNVTGSISNVALDYSNDNGLDGFEHPIVANVTASLGTYEWEIPDNISQQIQVKITNLSDPDVFDISNTFSILGKLVLVSPNGGEVWPVHSSQSITWAPVGSINTVTLSYSLNGGVSYDDPVISGAGITASDGSFTWTVPDEISSLLKVRVVDDDYAQVFDVSDANFKIRGDIAVTAPNGGEVWLINSSHDITWNAFGSIPSVDIYYSIDGGISYPLPVTSGIPAAQEFFNWTIPDNPSTQIKVKVYVSGDATVFDVSDANFIIRGGFEVLTPNGGEIWAVGATHNITWNTFGTITNVRLEYSRDNGAHWSVIQGTTPNSDLYTWIIPDAIDDQCIIRVADVNDVNANDISDAVFKIHGLITVDTPNGGEEWGVNTSENIFWTVVGSIANVRIEYSYDNGSTYSLVADPVGAGVGQSSYGWTIPDSISNEVYVKVLDSQDNTVFDVSDNACKIQGSFDITRPNGGDEFIVGDTENINWVTHGTVAEVKLEYSSNNGSTWWTIGENIANIDTYPWTVPDTISNEMLVRVAAQLDPNANDASNNVFRIRGNLTITTPNGGETWPVGSTQIIYWDRIGSIANISLEYSNDNGVLFVPIVASTPNTGSYSWLIPDAISTMCKVRITQIGDATVTDTTDGLFKIQGSFVINAPNGGEAWMVGSTHNIDWTKNGSVPFVKIELSTDSGTTYSEVVNSTANDGLYEWLIPDNVTGQAKIKISDTNDFEAFDESNGDFRVRAAYTLVAPNGAEQWRVNRTEDISWTQIGTTANVKLEYSRDNFLTDIQPVDGATGIVPSGAGGGTYAWTIPDSISDVVKVRVSDPNDIGANDISNADFRITADFAITTPNGGEMWDVGSTQTITWNSAGTVSDVLLEYSNNGGASFNIIGAVPNSGTSSWLIPDDINPTFRVRVSDLADSTANDMSDFNAKIKANFTLIAPNGGGGQELTVGEDYEITWSCVGTVANVQLDYSADDFATSSVIIATTPNDSSYIWKVPNAPGTAKVRVMSATDSDAYDTSDDSFDIVVGVLQITSPNGTERWVTREEHAITWQTVSGSIPLVNIEYSKDGFVSDIQTIVSNYANVVSPNSYTWTIPDDRSTSVMVRVSDIRDVTVNDVSDAVFTIDYYTVSFDVKDLLTNQHLSALSVESISDKGDEWNTNEMPGTPGAALGSPFSVELPYGFWTITFKKTEYGDKQITLNCNQDQTAESVFMETTAIHIWRAYSEFTYNAEEDNLKVTSWLERDGFVVSGAVSLDISIYDDSGTLFTTLNSTTPNAAGFFNVVMNSPTNLESNTVYSVITLIKNASDAEFKTPTSFSITTTQQLSDTQVAVEEMRDVTLPTFQSQIQQTLDEGVAEQQTMIEEKMDEQLVLIDTKTDEMITSVDTTLTSFEERTDEAIADLQAGAEQATQAGQELEIIAKRQSGELILPNSVLVGGNVEIRYRNESGLLPLMDIISYDGTLIYGAQQLIESASTAGLYGYDLIVDGNTFQSGKAFTVIVTEAETGNLQAGSVMVESTSLTSVEGLASSIPQIKSVTDEALEAIKGVEGKLATGGDISEALAGLQESIDDFPDFMDQQGGNEEMVIAMNDISERLAALADGEGFDISGMIEDALDKSPTIKELKKKTENIKSIVKFLQALFEHKFGGVEEEPVVSTSLSSGSLVVNVVAANPSSTKPQKTKVKVYLPKEVTPNDVIDLGGLDIEFDAGRSIYYVFRDEIELAPKEVRVYKVEIEDIWFVSQTSIDVMKLRAVKLAEALAATEYEKQANRIVDDVKQGLDEIVRVQNDIGLSREQHIGAYRVNIKKMEAFKSSLTDMEKLMIKRPDQVGAMTMAMTWKIILLVIAFIGLLSGVFFFTWYRKSGLTKEAIEQAKQFSFPEEGEAEEEENKK